MDLSSNGEFQKNRDCYHFTENTHILRKIKRKNWQIILLEILKMLWELSGEIFLCLVCFAFLKSDGRHFT